MEAKAKKIALVTGANKGIGFQIARELGKAGMIVLVGARNAELGNQAVKKLQQEGTDASFVPLDLANQATIDAAAATIKSEFGRLDVLVNNAGVLDAADGSPSAADLRAVRRVFDTNFFGTLAVTQAMLPLVRTSASGRIVNLSSGLGSITLNADPDWEFAQFKLIGYNGSKAALNMMTAQLAYELRNTPIKVNSVDPGYTATDMNANRGTQSVEEGAREAVRLALLPANGPSGGFFEHAGPRPW